MVCLNETFKIVMHDESEHKAKIKFVKPFQEIDLQVTRFTHPLVTLVTVIIYKCEKYASHIIKRFSVARRRHLLNFHENVNSERGKLSKTHDGDNRGGRKKEIQSTDDATNIGASNTALFEEEDEQVARSQWRYNSILEETCKGMNTVKLMSFFTRNQSTSLVVVTCCKLNLVKTQRRFWTQRGLSEMITGIACKTEIEINSKETSFKARLSAGTNQYMATLLLHGGLAYTIFLLTESVLTYAYKIDIFSFKAKKVLTMFEQPKTEMFDIDQTIDSKSRHQGRAKLHFRAIAFDVSVAQQTKTVQVRLGLDAQSGSEAVRVKLSRMRHSGKSSEILVSSIWCEMEFFVLLWRAGEFSDELRTQSEKFQIVCYNAIPSLHSNATRTLYYAGLDNHYPNQQCLDLLLADYGTMSPFLMELCEDVCKYFKKVSSFVVNVYPAYQVTNAKQVKFIVTIRQENCFGTLPKYKGRIRVVWDFSEETVETEFERSRIDPDLQENVMQCIRMNGATLMKEHTNLNIITASAVRRKRCRMNETILEKQVCLVFYVHMKYFIPLMEVPFQTEYDGIPVDVRCGAFRLFGDESLANMRMGCQIYRHRLEKCGTIGGFVDHPHYGLCGFTSAHVLLNSREFENIKGKPNGQMFNSHLDDYNIYQGLQDKECIGRLVHAAYREISQPIGVEVAMFKIHRRKPVDGQLNCTGYTFDTGHILGHPQHAECIKVGCSTGETIGRLRFPEPFTHVRGPYEMSLNEISVALPNQYEVERYNSIVFSCGGDSGALVFCEDYVGELVCIGMLEGETTFGTVAVTPITAVLDALGVMHLKEFEQEKVRIVLDSLNTKIDSVEQKLDNVVGKLAQDMRSLFEEVFRRLPDSSQNT